MSRQEFEDLITRHEDAAPADRAAIQRRIDERFGAPRSILLGDLSGYTRRVAQEGTVPFVGRVYRMRRLCSPMVRGNGGQVLRARGRAGSEHLFAAFFTPEAAVNAARAMQDAIALDNFQHDPPDRIGLTIGVATGRVLAVADEEVWGHAVNIASWLEQTARPGEILLCPETNAALRASGEAHQVEVSGYWLTFYRIDAPALGTD